MFISILPNQDIMVQLPTETYIEVYFFAKEETQLIIDGLTPQSMLNRIPHSLNQEHILYDPTITSYLKLFFWSNEPGNQGLENVTTIIPSIETLNLNPTVTLTLLEGGFPIIYVINGVAATAVAIILGLLNEKTQ